MPDQPARGGGGRVFTVKQKVAAEVANPLVDGGSETDPGGRRRPARRSAALRVSEAYERDARAVRPLAAYVRVLPRRPEGIRDRRRPVSRSWDAKSKALPIRFTIAAPGGGAGTYDCQVTVLDPGSARVAFWRTPVVMR